MIYEPGKILSESDVAQYLKNTGYYKGLYNDINSLYNRNVNKIQSNYNSGINALNNLYIADKNNIYNQFNESNRTLFSNYGNQNYNLGNQFMSDIRKTISDAKDVQSNYFQNSANMGTGYREQSYSNLMNTINQAYNNSITNYLGQKLSLEQSLIDNKNSIISERDELLSQITSALDSDVSKLKSDKDKSITSLTTDKDKATNELNKLVGESAANYVKLSQMPWEYLMYLDKEGLINYNTEGVGQLYDVVYEGGTPTGYLMDKMTFDSIMYNAETGQLTDAGQDFYNQMLYGTFDSVDGKQVPSFSEWLYNEDDKLYNWAGELGAGNYKDKAGNATNLTDVFGLMGLSQNIMTEGSYRPSGKGYNRTTTNKTGDFEGFGTGHYSTYGDESGKTVIRFDDIKYGQDLEDGKMPSGILNKADVSKGESFVIGTDEFSYSVKVKTDAEKASDDVLNYVNRNVGSIEDNKLYAYTEGDNKTLYYSTIDKDTGEVILREVAFTNNDQRETFWNTIDKKTRWGTASEKAEAERRKKANESRLAHEDKVERASDARKNFNEIGDVLENVEDVLHSGFLSDDIKLNLRELADLAYNAHNKVFWKQ